MCVLFTQRAVFILFCCPLQIGVDQHHYNSENPLAHTDHQLQPNIWRICRVTAELCQNHVTLESTYIESAAFR